MYNALAVSQLTKTFSSGFWPFSTPTHYTAVNQISFSLRPGETVGLLGPNGAGKTTTIQMLLGTTTPTSGCITYFGSDLAHHARTILRRVGYASGYDRFPPRLTVVENLDIMGRLYAVPSAERTQRIEELLKFFDLWNKRDTPTGALSAGQTTRVMLVKAFLAKPDIVLLDEPTASLDPDIAHEVRQFLLSQRKEHGTTLLITSHDMSEVEELCNRVLVLRQGEIIANDTPQNLARSVAQVYLHLTITHGLAQLCTLLTDKQLFFSSEGTKITIAVEEQYIASLLTLCAQHSIAYTHISLQHPSLEDYFVRIARPKGKV